MDTILEEMFTFVEEEDVKFIRLAFCDIFGVHKNIAIMKSELKRAFSDGIMIDGSSIAGFSSIHESDLFLSPDPTTLSALPWRPEPGRVIKFYCNIKNASGDIYHADSRSILKRAIKKLDQQGFGAKIGAECEFYLFKLDDHDNPVYIPLDNGSYLDVAPLDKGEDVRREICLLLNKMGLTPESSHHENGPGQNEIGFRYSDALSSADNIMTFKNIVKVVANRYGLYASFMPKPLEDESGSSFHINISLTKHGKNIFQPEHMQNDIRDYFIAGILSKINEITLFLNPTVNSYDRLGKMGAPKYISWSNSNRSALIRIPERYDERTRLELRSPDCSCNPYIVYALVISAGIYGIKNKLPLQQESNINLYDTLNTNYLKRLPKSLAEAISLAKNSHFVKEVLGEEFLQKYINLKEQELEDYEFVVDKQHFYTKEYLYKL
ncbi:MAG: hypothetical protein BEN19_03830 [Epulopiscium sp. Nuni2H_MBin003]|nr:MAG: hypothetical protein BEN19_03830 [Epulopiscium sp. Nuni2H_MBin003]